MRAALTVSLTSLALAACGWCGDDPKPPTPRPRPAAGPAAGPAPDVDPGATYSQGGVKLPDDLSAEVLRYVNLLVSHRAAAVDGLVALDEDAAPAMEALLDSDNVAELRSALEFMASTGRAENGARIAELTRHAAADVRIEALRALIALELREHAGAATQVLEDKNAAVRALAIEAVAALGSAKSARALVAQLDSDNVRVTVEAALALARIGDEEIAPLLVERVTSSRAATQVGALVAARRLGVEVPAEALATALESRDLHVVQEALKATALQGEATRAEVFERHLGDTRPEVRRVALEVYATFAPRGDVVTQAEKRLKQDQDPAVRASALDVLAAKTEAGELAARLVPWVADPDPDVRTTAYVHLGAAGADAVAPLVARLETEDDAAARKLLARALGELNAEAAIEPLIAVLEKKKPKDPARSAAWLALRKISGKDMPRKPERWREWLEEKKDKKAP